MFRITVYKTARTITRAAILFALAGLTALAGADSPAQSPWIPSPALAAKLGPAQTAPSFTICPPPGYEVVHQQGPDASSAYAWRGPARPDGSHGYIMVVLITVPKDEETEYTAPQILDRFLKSIAARRQNWSQSPDETGKIGALTFCRSYWKGTATIEGTTMNMAGFGYVNEVGNKVIYLSSQDVFPGQQSSLDLAEASALTFHKK